MTAKSNTVATMLADMRAAHDRLFGPLDRAMAAIPLGDPLPTIEDIADAIHSPQPHPINITIIIQEDDQ